MVKFATPTNIRTYIHIAYKHTYTYIQRLKTYIHIHICKNSYSEKSLINYYLKTYERLQIFLRAVLHSSYNILFYEFYFIKWNTFQKYNLKKPLVKVKSISKVMPNFVFHLWHHIWETFGTPANFLYNSSLSRDARFLTSDLTSDQVSNQASWKLVQMESTYLKH